MRQLSLSSLTETLVTLLAICAVFVGCGVQATETKPDQAPTVDIDATIRVSVEETAESIRNLESTVAAAVKSTVERLEATATPTPTAMPTSTLTPLPTATPTNLPPTDVSEYRNEILGIVVNASEGGVIPPEMTILLMAIDNETNQIIEQESTTVGDDGTFSFSNLTPGPGLGFRVVADAGDYSPSIDLAGVNDWSNVRLVIYDQTVSLEDISISSYVMMIPTTDGDSRQAGVLTVANVKNNGDHVWIPDIGDPNLTGLDLLRFNLPDGVSDLSVESELPAGNILQIESGFAMTNPIPPGEFAILFSYIVSYDGDGFDFDLKLSHGADELKILLPKGEGSATANSFGDTNSVIISDNSFNSVEGTGYTIGDQIAISFYGLPQPTAKMLLPGDEPRPPSGALDLSKTYIATFTTDSGTFEILLFDNEAPLTVENFINLATIGYYDGLTFHRVIADFMAQGGDPDGTGAGGPKYRFRDEFDSTRRHDKPGILSMANSGLNTNRSQFFITFVSTPHLDGKHTVFGEVISGLDTVLNIQLRDPGRDQIPGERIESIVITEG